MFRNNENAKIIKYFFKSLGNFHVLFKTNLFFKGFQDSPSFSSTFQACVNLVHVRNLEEI